MLIFRAIILSAVITLSGQNLAVASERAEQAWQLAQQGAVIVDVRTDDEFNSGHIEGALHIPLHELGQRLNELPAKNNPIVLYCRSGNRSGQALRFLAEQGYNALHNGGGLGEMRRTQPQ